MVSNRIGFIILFLLGAVMASAQYTSDTKDEQVAKKKLRVGTDTSKYFTTISTVVDASATHRQLPTNKSVWDLFSTVSPTVTTDATLSGAGTVGSPLKIAQQSAGTGQVLKWNGTTWLPAADDNTGMTYTAGTGISISSGIISNTGDLSNTNEIQNLSLSGQSLGISSGTGVTLPVVGITAGTGISLSPSAGNYTVTNSGDLSNTNEIELPTQTGNNGKVLSTNGTSPSWITPNAGTVTGTGTSGQIPYFISTTGITSEAGSGANAITWDPTNNRLGIAKTAPAKTLDVAGDIQGSQSLYLGDDFKIYANGALVWNRNNAAGNILIGNDVGNLTLSGNRNIGLGAFLFTSLTSGEQNVAMGQNTLRNLTSGAANIGIGINTLTNVTTGSGNVATGGSAGGAITTGNYNFIFGSGAGALITTQSGNVAMGFRALHDVTNSYNIGIGYQALEATNATETVAIGTEAGALAFAQTNSTLIGRGAGWTTTAATSTFIGYGAGFGNTTNNTLAIDYNPGFSSNKTPLIGGNFSTGMVGINTAHASLGASLHVTGTGATSGTYSARFANSTPNYALSVRNDRAVIFDNLSGTGNRLLQLDASGVSSRSSLDPATLVTANIYTADGTLAGNRIATVGNNYLRLDASAASNTVSNPLVIKGKADGTNETQSITFQNAVGNPLSYIYVTNVSTFFGATAGNKMIVGAGTNGVEFNESGYTKHPLLAVDPTVTNIQSALWFNSASSRYKYNKTNSGTTPRQIANVEDDVVGTSILTTSSAYTLTGTVFRVQADANTNTVTITVDGTMQEGYTYLVRCRRNGTNAITISSGAGYTLGVDGDSTLSPTTYTCAAYEVLKITRYDNIIFVDK